MVHEPGHYGSKRVGKAIRKVRRDVTGEGAKPSPSAKKGPPKKGLISRIFGSKKKK